MSSLLLTLALPGQAISHASRRPFSQLQIWVKLITVVFIYSPETRLIGQILVFVIWIAGIVYCDRVADDQDWNSWVARLIGILLPIAGPLYYWLRRARHRTRHRIRRGSYIR